MSKRIKCTLSYDGTHFSGYQIQPGKRTVQGELERVLEQMHKGKAIRATASGRTDAGVHAYGQVIHFDTFLSLSADQWKKALNAQLPDDIVIKDVQEADPSFHARFSAKAKEYRYKVRIAQERDVFLRNYCYHYPYPLDMEAMRRALRLMEGTHDFTSFCSAKTDIDDRIRTIYQADMAVDQEMLEFRLIGNGFLYNMVRIIVGTILEVGQGKRSADSISTILEAKDRRYAGPTAPPQGLYLWKVYYDN
ncbi:tRNA pseudouridine(38-40) synthase TruA [Saccharococcus caldoxylosilyticus]|jgi:tRNA pseudouridine38-40 synthase|uniref:tRNA pseudouridine synthase A n=2 Tax=Saccharococcus caldoxylosilyticus TaxID=81408 RepID=A0A023DGI2_9BACL|nr:tRNA pseudouridine(38-40) synthase TruA [Parageobacillus caldoxylosilyticus]OQP03976.1 tRNA pseudouridine(38-40) synthase TruA [Geobacillus sp. 44B]KYD15412.1 tRNA pseudouridine synthase A [Parageobacillus caldoxylosilyticus]MBB3853553.1 tRNA pseudouridine38-40 synthase [Parageobacillus caldoxylosilyticus]QNU38557.1 tRNA pseudouridine(38-40) synthase TruA [Geobacillus sp. 44B]QXJ38301.1 tRNA pseudouridine synthase A [Parageobacillus caldoxylosilyticus]